MIDECGIVDSHCHPFLPSHERGDFDACWTLSLASMPAEDIRSTVLFQMMAGRLARFLGMPPGSPWPEVARLRAERYAADPKAYVRELFADAGIATLLIDIGYPSVEDEGFEIETADFKALLPQQDIRVIVRIEPVMYRLLDQQLPFAEFVPAFRAALQKEIEERGAVAIKSTIAYYTGLNVERTPVHEARTAYERVLKDRPAEQADPASAKAYRDCLFLEALAVAAELDVPVQVHTGMGNAPGIYLRAADPSNLQWLLADPHFARAKVVLVHGGYPNHAGAAFLASTHPNVWLDVSEMVPFVGAGAAARLRELLDTAPLRKVMYGSDGFNIPEIFWFAARQFRDSLAEVMDGLAEAGHVSVAFAQEAVAGILAANARRLYRL